MGTKAAARGRIKAPADDHANVGPRLLAYFLDGVALFAFTMIFATVSFLNIFLRSDSGNHNTTDGAIWTSVAILVLAVPIWLIVNLILCYKRGQTLGQYVIGLGILDENEERLGFGRLVFYWLALHPLLFHPLVAFPWALFAFVAISLSASSLVFIVGIAVAILCFLAPILGLVFLLADPQRRALHDRIAGVKVVRLQ